MSVVLYGETEMPLFRVPRAFEDISIFFVRVTVRSGGFLGMVGSRFSCFALNDSNNSCRCSD